MTDLPRVGTPSLDEWNGPWRSSPDDPPFDGDEFESVCDEFYLELVNPAKLTPDFLFTLQSWLTGDPYRYYRLFVITYVSPGGTPVIYPNVIRFGEGFCFSIPDGVDRIRRVLRLPRGGGDMHATLADWPRVRRIMRTYAKSTWRQWVRIHPKSKDFEPGHWITDWGPVVAASDIYDALRPRLASALRRSWDELFIHLFWRKPRTWDDRDESCLTHCLSPSQVRDAWLLAHSLAVETLRPAFKETCPIRRSCYLSRFDEFARYIADWTLVLDQVRSTGLALLIF